MSPQVLQIKRLEVSRMPGFPAGLRLKNDFSPRFNIITGPNASGKSSFARAIQQVIWNDRSQRYTLTALAHAGEDQWRFDLDAGFVRAQRNGNPETFQPPLAEDRPRYLLSLHDLITANEAELATEIHRQLSGGYDLQAAARALSFNSSVAGSRINPATQLKEATDEVVRIQDEQRELHKDQQGLARLGNERQEIEKKLQLEKCIATARALRDVENALRDALEKRSSFPEAMEYFRVSDFEDAEKYEEQIAKTEIKLRSEIDEIQRAKNQISELLLPDEGVEDAIERVLQPMLDDLKSLGLEIKALGDKLQAANTRRETAARDLGVSDPETEWSGIDANEFAQLENEWLTVWQDVARQIALQSEIDLLREKANEKADRIAEPEKIKQGIYVLTRWLQAQGSGEYKSPFVWPVYALGTLAVLAAWAGANMPIYWVVPLVVILSVLIIFLAGKNRRGNSSQHSESDFLSEFNQLGLGEDLKPDIELVKDQIESLIRQWTAAEAEHEAGIRADQLQRDLKATQLSLEKFQEKLNQQRAKLGLVGQEVSPQSKTAMYLLVKHFISWIDARNEYLETQSLLGVAEKKAAEKLQIFNQTLVGLNRQPVSGFKEAESVLTALKKSLELRNNAVRQIGFTEKEVERQTELLNEKKQVLNEIFTRLNIDADKKYQLREYHLQWHDFQTAVTAVDDTRRNLKRIKDELESLETYQNQKSWVDSLSAEELERESKAFEELRQRRDEIINETGNITGKIEQLQRDGQLGSALMQQERCYEELESAFEANLHSLTGSAVVNALQEANHEKNDSKLFQKADQLFRRITHQQFSLRIPDGADQAFRAFDEVRQIGLSLEELSTGTRIQLLMAVRLAYIETHEHHYRLPLLADELLANTDDIRAAAIIEALTEISRSGRQVFYFTAQADEVQKWQKYLDQQEDIEYTVISLEGKSGETLDFSGLNELPKSENPVPPPENSDYISYGSLLEVPEFNLLLNKVEEIHLWYLIDDLETLYQFLIHRIRFWGQLRQLSDSAPLFFKGNWPLFFDDVKRKAELVRDVQGLYRVGRNVPVNRKVLLDSGAVSDKFIDPVSTLLAEVKGDPEMLLLQLENKAVSGFRQISLENLRNYFASEGFISKEEKAQDQEFLNQFYTLAARHQVTTDSADLLLRVLGISKPVE